MLGTIEINDFLNLSKEKSILKAIKLEKILISCLVFKYNRKNVRQQRSILITDKAVYNLKKTSVKRKIPIEFIKGITVSKLGTEFVLHVPSEYDYRYSTLEYRDKIIQAIRAFQQNMSIFYKNDSTLINYTTTRTDKKKNINRMPQEETSISFDLS